MTTNAEFAMSANQWEQWANGETRAQVTAAWTGLTAHLVMTGFFTPAQLVFLNALLKIGSQ